VTVHLVEADGLRDRIAEFPRWHYQFEFEGGVTTPVADRGKVNRHEQRRRYFFDALLRLAGGSLRGRRVLDLGCNAGFWSLTAIEADADFVLGVDAQQMHIDQAKLVFETKGVDPSSYRFEQGNVLECDLGERFDVVLCLGLMEHVAKPVELFELMARVGAEIIVIDTALSRARSSFFEVARLHGEIVDYPMALVPTREAVIELAGMFGFEALPLAVNISDYAGMEDYRTGRRLAFMCAKGVSLDDLPRESASAAAPDWMGALRLAGDGLRRLRR
jgi:SAM-dependent methyltransferase